MSDEKTKISVLIVDGEPIGIILKGKPKDLGEKLMEIFKELGE